MRLGADSAAQSSLGLFQLVCFLGGGRPEAVGLELGCDMLLKAWNRERRVDLERTRGRLGPRGGWKRVGAGRGVVMGEMSLCGPW